MSAGTDAEVAGSASGDAEAGLPFFHSFTPRDYRGHFQIWTITEDASGLLYFGNLNKVLSYDGARWTNFEVPGAAFVRGLAVDAQDVLWIGGVDELGYAKSDPTGTRTFISLLDRLPPETHSFGDIWTVAVTAQGIIFQSASWLMRWDGTAFATLQLPASPRWRLTQIGAEWWASDSQHGWFRIDDDGRHLSLAPIALPPGLQSERAVGSAPAVRPAGVLIATDRSGIWRWDGAAFSRFPTSADEALRRARVYSMEGLSDGRFAVGSLKAGIWIFDAQGRAQAHLTEETGLADNTAGAVFAPRDGGSLWAGLALGAVRIDVRPWLTWFNPVNGAPRAKLHAPVRYHDQLLIPANAGGVLHLVPATAETPALLMADTTNDLSVDSLTIAHDTLIRTTPNQLVEVAADGSTRPLPDSPINATGFLPLPDQPDTWAALNNNRVRRYRYADGSWRSLGDVPGLERVRGIAFDRDGSWWLGRPVGGVLHATFPHGLEAPPVVEALTAPQALPPRHGWTRFVQDDRGPLLACNVGLFRYSPTTQQFLPTADYGAELADGATAVIGAVPDAAGGLWMIAQPSDDDEAGNGLRLVYGRNGHLTPLRIPQLTLIDDPSLFGYEPPAAGRPETLWLVGHSALVRLDLDRWRAAPTEPPPELRLRAVFSRGGRSLALTGGWTLPFHDRSIEVHFAAPELAAHPGATYESTLISSSGAEVHRDQTPSRTFSALGSGHYALKLRACYPGGAWSPSVLIAFQVLPPWWRSPLAGLLYATGVGLLIILSWRIRVRGLLHRQHELEDAVFARTTEIAAQNTELIRLRQIEFDEKLAARLAEEKARLEVLRYQLNPHFLFNTLNAICAQIIKAPRAARESVIRLAEFCRLTLHRPDENAARTLREELTMLRAYLGIEQTRLGDLLDCTIESDPTLADLRLPPFLLLPLVENAVKYGTATSQDRVQVRLTVRRGAQPDAIEIEVINSGQWIEPETTGREVPSLGIGLENLRQRLTRYYPDRHEFTAAPNHGWVVMRLVLRDPTIPPLPTPV